MAQLDAFLTGDQEVIGSTLPSQQHSFVEIDHEILSMVIHFLPLIQEGHVSFWGKNVHNTGIPLIGLSLASKSVVR